MQDRLRELREIGGDPVVAVEMQPMGADAAAPKGSGSTGAAAPPPAKDAAAFMPDFFEEIERIKHDMTTIKSNTEKIRALSKDAAAAVKGAEASNKASRDLKAAMEQNNTIVRALQQRLEQMKTNNEAYGKSPGASTTEMRIRANTLGTLTNKFVAIMKDYNDAQSEYQSQTKEKFERQCKIVKPDATPEEIDAAMQSGDVQVFTNAILDQQMLENAQAALSYIENKHADILRLQQSIQELQQLFVDMAVLVAAQGELLDHIEYNCDQSLDYVKKGVVELREANKLQKKSRKKMFIILAIVIVIIVVIVIVAALTGGLKFG